MAKSVRFLGFVDDTAAFYGALDVLAAPSRWEGFGLMLVEAMAAGCPIVASRAGAVPEVAGTDGAALLVPPDDPAALASAIQNVLDDDRCAQRLREIGRARAHDFSWEKSGLLLDDIYHSLVSRSAQ